MRRARKGAFLLAVAAAACGPSDAQRDIGPEATFQVEVFAPGAVSSELPEFATAFTLSGDTVFFNRTPPDRSRIDLLFSVRVDTGWTVARPYAPLEGVRALDPFVAPDGIYLYFSSDLPIEGLLDGSFNLWRVPLSQEGGSLQPLPPPINTDSSEIFNSISAHGWMVFSSWRAGAPHVYETRLEEEGRWTEPTRLLLGDEGASNPAVHPTGRYLVFARTEADGASDLFVACALDRGWSSPVRLPEPINGRHSEFAPGFGGDFLYFTSERPGVAEPVTAGERPPGDIYRVESERVEALCGR